MQLMNMKGVQLAGTVLDDPVLHGALLRDDVWHAGGHVKHLRLLPVDGQIKFNGAGGVVGVGELLREIEPPDADGLDVSQPRLAGGRKRIRRSGEC